jgi:hypothetical protein
MEYMTEVGIPVGVGTRGGRKEADVVGGKLSLTNENKKTLQVYHVEVGVLGGNKESNVDFLLEKFSSIRTEAIRDRFVRRMGQVDDTQYRKLYVDIWATEKKVAGLMSDERVNKEQIKVWTLKKLFQEVFGLIRDYVPEYKSKSGEATLPDSYWMLKLLESLRDWKLLNTDVLGA